MDFRVGFIGGGNMAKALCFGMLKKKILKPENVHVSGPHLENLKDWINKGVTNVTICNFDLVLCCDIIFICVKPHYFEAMAADLRSDFDKSKADLSKKVWVSVMGGTTLEKLTLELGFYSNPKIIRSLPNTPVEVGCGVVVYTAGPHVTANENLQVKTLLQSISICNELPENLINAASALAGSGPAYIYQVIESLADGGVKMGLPRATANTFAAQTVLGAAQMVLESGKHPGLLKDEVCSAGGSTIAGVHELEKGGVRSSFINAVQAAKFRGDEMGKLN